MRAKLEVYRERVQLGPRLGGGGMGYIRSFFWIICFLPFGCFDMLLALFGAIGESNCDGPCFDIL